MPEITTTDCTFSELSLPEFDDSTLALYLVPLHSSDGKHVFSANTSAVLKLLEDATLPAVQVNADGMIRYRDERAFTWLGPAIFVTTAALTENPHLVSLALGVISNYLSDLFKGRKDSESVVKLRVIVRNSINGSCRRIGYDGPLAGLSHVSEIVDAAVRGD